MSSSPQLAKAVMIPMNGDDPETDTDKHIVVQFNPVSLKVALSNTLKADNAGGESSASAQFIDKSESTLTVQLVFDSSVPGAASLPAGGSADSAAGTQAAGTSSGPSASGPSAANHQANSDVRLLTQKVADTFMNPEKTDPAKPGSPKRCRFQWGAFVFVGMVSSYNETLDYFSPEGVPLRATLALTLKEDRYQFELGDTRAGDRTPPSFASGGNQKSASDAATAAKKNPRDWRDVAMFNGIENPRLTARAGLSIPGVSLSASVGVAASVNAGFSAGASASIGTSIPGAFTISAKPPRVDFSATVKAPQISIRVGEDKL